jgi:hypothetical protein
VNRLTVYLLKAEDETWFGFTSEPAAGEPADPPGWLARIHHRFQEGITRHLASPDRLLGRLLHRLERMIGTDEALLRYLRTAWWVDFQHPAAVPPDLAVAAWTDFLQRRRRRHLVWTVLASLVAPLTVVLAPLPGPNLVGYWVLFRAVGHCLAWCGAARAARGGVPIALLSCDGLERAPDETESEWTARIVERCGLDGPHRLIRHVGRPLHRDPRA